MYIYHNIVLVHSGDFTKNHDIEDLYLAVKEYHGNRKQKSLHEGETTLGIQHPSLIPQLRPYQKEAVQWMIEQESDIGSIKEKLLMVN
jgi:SNF2 family DNA or RNA helicase